MMQSRRRRAGSPVLLAFGPGEVENGKIRLGLLFVSAQLDDIPYALYDPDAPDGRQVTVKLPRPLVNCPNDVMRTNFDMEVME